MTNKQKQSHVALKMITSDKRIRRQLVRKLTGKRKLSLPAFLNLWKCKKGACRKLSK